MTEAWCQKQKVQFITVINNNLLKINSDLMNTIMKICIVSEYDFSVKI